MAHEISTASGRAEMFYVGQAPWHGLGTKVEGAANSTVALKAAGLDWTVRMEDMSTASGIRVPMGQAVVRDDTNEVLGMVGRRWKPCQNHEAFAFLDSLVGDQELLYETAGALFRGERVWMLARMPKEMRIEGTDDVTRPYLLLANWHDGFGSLRCFFTGVRVVCQNTLNMASTQKAMASGICIRHTGDLSTKIEEARRVLGIAAKFFDRAEEDMNRLAGMKVTRTQAYSYFTELFPDPTDKEKQKLAAKNAEEARAEVERLFDKGAGADMKKTRHTMWTAYNAVTEYVDHVVKTTDRAKALDHDERQSRLASVWFGNGASLKGKAWEAAMAAVGARN